MGAFVGALVGALVGEGVLLNVGRGVLGRGTILPGVVSLLETGEGAGATTPGHPHRA